MVNSNMSDPNVLSRKSMSSLVNLTKEQIDILETKKNTIVIANPGTGKTTTLSHKVILLLENGVKPEDILCITYTEKAKKEMFDKIYEIGIEKKIPDSQIMKLHIHTFHSFAYNYLVDNGFVTGDIVGNNLMRYSILESFEKNRASKLWQRLHNLRNCPKNRKCDSIHQKFWYFV